MMQTRPRWSRQRLAAVAIAAAAVLVTGPALIAQTKGGATKTDKKPVAKDKATATGSQQSGSSAAQNKILQARQKLSNKRPQVGPPAPGKAGRPSTSTINPKARGPNIPKPTVTLKPGEVPKIDFDTPEYKFGRVRSGSDIIHEFWFTNTGTGPLEILSVKPG